MRIIRILSHFSPSRIEVHPILISCTLREPVHKFTKSWFDFLWFPLISFDFLWFPLISFDFVVSQWKWSHIKSFSSNSFDWTRLDLSSDFQMNSEQSKAILSNQKGSRAIGSDRIDVMPNRHCLSATVIIWIRIYDKIMTRIWQWLWITKWSTIAHPTRALGIR